jgi:hypothetical protein
LRVFEVHDFHASQSIFKLFLELLAQGVLTTVTTIGGRSFHDLPEKNPNAALAL